MYWYRKPFLYVSVQEALPVCSSRDSPSYMEICRLTNPPKICLFVSIYSPDKPRCSAVVATVNGKGYCIIFGMHTVIRTKMHAAAGGVDLRAALMPMNPATASLFKSGVCLEKGASRWDLVCGIRPAMTSSTFYPNPLNARPECSASPLAMPSTAQVAGRQGCRTLPYLHLRLQTHINLYTHQSHPSCCSTGVLPQALYTSCLLHGPTPP